MKATVEVLARESRESLWNTLFWITEDGNIKSYERRQFANIKFSEAVKRGLALQRVYSVEDMHIRFFCETFKEYNWEDSVEEKTEENLKFKIHTEFPICLRSLHKLVCKKLNIKEELVNVNIFDLGDLLEKEEERKKFKDVGIYLGNNAILLDSGKYLVNDYGKYCSSLTFIIAPKNIVCYKYREDRDLAESINVMWDGDPTFMFGNYWKSKKGTRCFEPCDKKYAKHILISVSWGGCFNHTSGLASLSNAIYTNRARSNGGGTGTTYYIIPINSKNTISEDEI